MMYWTDDGSVYRSDLDGNGIQQIHDLGATGLRVEFIDIDVANRNLYQLGRTEGLEGFVRRTDLDGNNAQMLLFGISAVKYGFALNQSAGKMYLGFHREGIQTADLNGAGLSFFYGFPLDSAVGPLYPHDMVVDEPGGRLYFTDAVSFDGIRSVDLSGANLTDHVQWGPPGNFNDSASEHIALDAENDLLYFTRWRPGEVGVLDLTDGSTQILVSGLPGAADIEIDFANGKLYWTMPDRIQRSNLDGTNVEDVLFLTGNGGWRSDSLLIANVPETSSIALTALGFTSLAAWGWRRPKQGNCS